MSSAAATTGENPIYSPFFGVMGAASAIIFSGKHITLVHTRARPQQQQCTAHSNNDVFLVDRRRPVFVVARHGRGQVYTGFRYRFEMSVWYFIRV